MRPHLDALGDGKRLRDPGNHDRGRSLRRKVRELRVLSEEQQVGLGRQPETDFLVRDSAKTEGDDVFSLVARVPKAPVKVNREVLVEENPHQVSGDLLHGWRQVGGDVSRIPDGGENLVTAQVVCLLNGLHAVACPDRPNDRGDIDACTGKTGLAEANARVHRDPWVDLRLNHLLMPALRVVGC